jgi:HTH-type transcriptional regulator/antitoxin HigA
VPTDAEPHDEDSPRAAVAVPDWASPPGDTLLEFAAERGWDTAHLARQLRLGVPETRALLAGDLPIDAALADQLAVVTGSSSEFWTMREAGYRSGRGDAAAGG